uniref:Ig-like domain-containing protein n=1 Tax=Apteryx owenii TaxID=8824 RepID=A0A8B9P159_APTOW
PDVLCNLPPIWEPGLKVAHLVASGPKEGKVSRSLTLTCTVSTISVYNGNKSWHCFIHYTPTFQGCSTISADQAKNKVSLHLHTLTPTDTATYFCASYSGTDARKNSMKREWAFVVTGS